MLQAKKDRNFEHFNAVSKFFCLRVPVWEDVPCSPGVGPEYALHFAGFNIIFEYNFLGHVLGAAMFLVKVGSESVLYTGD